MSILTQNTAYTSADGVSHTYKSGHIQTWHGTALKKMGVNTPQVRAMLTADRRKLAKAVGRRGSVVAVDIAPRMLELARKSAPANVRFVYMPAERLVFRDATFDVLTKLRQFHVNRHR